jgi:hypothetical protein
MLLRRLGTIFNKSGARALLGTVRIQVVVLFLFLVGSQVGCISPQATELSGALATGSLLGTTTTTVTYALTITSGPNSTTNATSATIVFTATPTSSTTNCSLDGAAAVACTSPVTYLALADGAHSVTVTIVDTANATQATATHSWTVDTALPAAPGATLASSTPTNSTAATITIASCAGFDGIFVNEGAAPLASDAGWQTCSTTAGAITFTMAGDGAHTLKVWSKDAAGNVSATSTDLAVSLDATAPSVTLTSLTGGQSIPGGANYAVTWTASDAVALAATPITISVSTDSGTSWATLATNEANDGTYTWAVPAATNSSTYRIRVTATDAVTNSASSSSTSDFIVDSTAPVFTAGQMTINSGSASTANNYAQVTLQAVDALSNVTHFCLKSNSSTAPTASASCWVSVTATPPSLSLSPTLSLTNYSFLLGFSGGVYTVYAWAKDAAGNISSLTAAGAGTDARDRDSITYTPGSPPSISDILVANTSAPSAPPTSGELTIPSASTVYIKWRATDDNALSAGAVALYYTTDDSTFTLIANNLDNASNSGCTVNDAGTTADDLATGCYTWTNGSPSNSYFKIRVTVTDSNGMVSFSTSTPLNVWPPIKFLAGNTEPGLGASATSSIFFSNTSSSSIPDPHSFVVKTDGTIFFRDINRGILKIDPATGVQSLYIPTTGTASGDTGAATSATLKDPTYIALDYNERLLIHDYDRIRRVESNGTIDTIIGGGASSNATESPLNVQINAGTYASNGTFYGNFFALPNGNIFFNSDPPYTWTNRRVRYYDAASGLVKSFTFSGTGDSTSGATVITDCAFMNFAVEFNPSTGAVLSGILDNYHNGVGGAGCNTGGFGGFAFDSTGAAAASHPANNYIANRVVGRDGLIYAVNRNNGLIQRYSSTTRTWTTLVGTGGLGTCSDGTLATSCPIDPQDAFITTTSRIYFVDRGRIRYVDDSGNVVTLAGQAFSYGDGGSALSARFGRVNDVALWNDAGTDKVLALDLQEMRLREFPIDGNISTIAGNGINSAPNTTTAANVQSIYISGNGQVFDYFTVDSSGNVYMPRSFNYLGKLNRATGIWSNVAGGGATGYTTADGLIGSNIALSPSYQPIVLGFDGTSLLTALLSYSGGYTDSMLKLYTVANGTQSAMAGVTGAATSSYCASGVGTALTSCAVPYLLNQSHIDANYDSFGSRWIASTVGSTTPRVLVAGGNMVNLTTLPRGANAIAYRHDAGNNIVYYCASTNSRLYKYNITTATETALAWPISSMTCAGRAMTYSSSRGSLIFIYKQNNLYGIAEYQSP